MAQSLTDSWLKPPNVLIGPELRKLGRCVDIHICLWPDFTIRSSHLITLTWEAGSAPAPSFKVEYWFSTSQYSDTGWPILLSASLQYGKREWLWTFSRDEFCIDVHGNIDLIPGKREVCLHTESYLLYSVTGIITRRKHRSTRGTHGLAQSDSEGGLTAPFSVAPSKQALISSFNLYTLDCINGELCFVIMCPYFDITWLVIAKNWLGSTKMLALYQDSLKRVANVASHVIIGLVWSRSQRTCKHLTGSAWCTTKSMHGGLTEPALAEVIEE